jgi:hypothetical protein
VSLVLAAALAVQAAPAASATPPPAPTAQSFADVDADEGSEDIVVVGDSGSETTLSADALRDAAQAFQRHRPAFAPQARFFFRVQPSAGQSLENIDLRLRDRRRNADGGYDRIDLTLDADGMFELPVEVVLSGTWSLRTSAPAGTLRIRPQILSPGSSLYDRRFGDARLQCRVAIAFARLNIAFRALASAANPCNRRNVGLYLAAPRPIDAVMITGWTEPIEIRPDRLSFRVPLHEEAISNDARMRITFR